MMEDLIMWLKLILIMQAISYITLWISLYAIIRSILLDSESFLHTKMLNLTEEVKKLNKNNNSNNLSISNTNSTPNPSTSPILPLENK